MSRAARYRFRTESTIASSSSSLPSPSTKLWVNLEHIDGELLQPSERGEASAEVIDGESVSAVSR
jgi:hypothetical protein